MTTSSTNPPPRLFGFGIESFRPSPRRSRRTSHPATRPRHPQPRRCPRSPPPQAPQRLSLPPSHLRPLAASSPQALGFRRPRLRCGLFGLEAPQPRQPRPRSRLDLSVFLGLAHALGVDRFGLSRRGRRRDQLLVDAPAALGDASRLADPAAQVVELGPAHVAAGGDLEFLDLRRVQREGSLDADTEGLLADGEGLAHSRALPPQDDSLEDLGAAALALDDLKVHADAIARIEGRETLPQLASLDVVDDAAHAKKDRRARTGRRAVAEW